MKKLIASILIIVCAFVMTVPQTTAYAATSATSQTATSTTVTAKPNANDVWMTFFFYRNFNNNSSHPYRIKGISDDYHVMADYTKSTSKKLDGVQYVYAKDKAFKKVYTKGTMKLTMPKLIKTCDKDSGEKGQIGQTIQKIKYGKCWVKWRVYKTVNGKKIYSKWKMQYMWMNGFTLN